MPLTKTLTKKRVDRMALTKTLTGNRAYLLTAALRRTLRCSPPILSRLKLISLSHWRRRTRTVPRSELIRFRRSAATRSLVWASQSGLPGNSIIDVLSGSRQAGRWPSGMEHANTPTRLPARPAAQVKARLTPGHGQIHLRQDLCVQQGAVQISL